MFSFSVYQVLYPGINFSALQVSDQCVKLHKEGWFKSQAEASGVITLVDPRVSSDSTTNLTSCKSDANACKMNFMTQSTLVSVLS